MNNQVHAEGIAPDYTEAAARLRARWPEAVVEVSDDGLGLHIEVGPGRICMKVALDAGGWLAAARRRLREGYGSAKDAATVEAACDEALRDLANNMLRMVDDAEAAARAVSRQVQAMTAAPTTGRAAADGGE